jgi:hypothetical protein
MLTDGVKERNTAGTVKVLDIAEILLAAVE